MHLNQVPRFIEIMSEAGRVPFLWGEAGIGKSQVVWDTAQKLGYGVIDLRLGQMEEGDLIGLPRTREVNGVFVTSYARPEWWPCPDEKKFKETGEAKYASKGFLFLDEFNRAGTTSVIQAMFQLILGTRNPITKKIERFMHSHKLPNGWFPICAGNPNSGEYVVQALDTAMLDRFVQVVLTKDQKSIVSWMREHLKTQEIVTFCASTTTAIGANPKFNLVVNPSPRSYEFVDDICQAMNEEDLKNMGMEVFSGCLGDTLGKMFYLHLMDNLVKPIPAEEIMTTRNFEKLYEEKIKKYIEGDKKRLELLDETLHGIIAKINEKEPTDFQSENIHKFLQILPKDMVLNFLIEITKSQNCASTYISVMKNEETMLSVLETIGYSREEVLDAVEQLKKIVEENKKKKTK